jgi:hypothetical protein
MNGRKCGRLTDRLGDLPFAVDVSSHTDLRTNQSMNYQPQSNPELNTLRQQVSPVQTHPKLRFAINQQFWRRCLCWCSRGSLISVHKLATTTDTRQLLYTTKCWHVIIWIHLPCNFNYFVLRPTNAQLSHKLSHCHMFRHYRVILRQLVINTLPSNTSTSNAASGKIYVKHLNWKLYYQHLHLGYLCNLARYWLQAAWGWHDIVETCSSVIICEIIVHLLVLIQNKSWHVGYTFLYVRKTVYLWSVSKGETN